MALEMLARKLATTISNYLRGAADAVTRKRMYLAMTRDKGKLTFNHSGKDVDWGIEFDEQDIMPYTGTLTFDPVNPYIRAVLPWGGYYMTDSIQKREKLMNDGKEALIKVYTDMGEHLEQWMTRKFPGRLIRGDPSIAGREQEYQGLNTIYSISGVVAASATIPVGLNNGTYAGLSTAPGAIGGTWAQVGGNDIWPEGDGSTAYDFHRPLVVLYDSAALAGAANSWDANAETAIRYALDNTNGRNAGQDNQVDLVLLWRNGYTKFKNIQTAKERINVTGQSTVYRLGFKDVFNFDGVDVTTDYDIPSEIGYGIPFGQVHIMSMQGELFDVMHDFHHDTHTDRFSIDNHGQQKFKTIRNFFQLRPTTLSA